MPKKTPPKPKRGRPVKFGFEAKPVSFKVTAEQRKQLLADVAKADKAGKPISEGEAARRRCFPETVLAVHLVEHVPEYIERDAPPREARGTTAEVLAAPWLARLSSAPGFIRWSMSGDALMAEFQDGRDWAAARVKLGELRGLPKWRGPRRATP